jgi:hypothetical protein
MGSDEEQRELTGTVELWGINDGSDGEDAEEMLSRMRVGYGCQWCKNLNEDNVTCKAFPDGIPTLFLSGQGYHAEVIVGQECNFVFDPIEDKRIKR